MTQATGGNNNQSGNWEKNSGDKNARNGEKAEMDGKKEKNAHQHAWLRVRQQLQAKLGSEVFNSWFGRIKMEGVSGGVALHSVPTAFLKSWINSHYRDLIFDLWKNEDPSVLRADIVIRSAVRRDISNVAETSEPVADTTRNGAGEPAQKPFAMVRSNKNFAQPPASDSDIGFSGSPPDARHTFANFL